MSDNNTSDVVAISDATLDVEIATFYRAKDNEHSMHTRDCYNALVELKASREQIKRLKAKLSAAVIWTGEVAAQAAIVSDALEQP